MKTDDLIAALAADAELHGQAPALAPTSAIARAIVLGGLVSAALLLLTVGIRPDFAAAAQTWRFDLKLALAGLALVAAIADCVRLTRPTAPRGPHALTIAVVVLLMLLVLLELAVTPSREWTTRLVGTNAWLCLGAIPALSVVPFAAAMYAMRAGAPSSPTRAGAAVGVLAASIGAALYATHCFDDSPLFVAVWYPLAMLLVGAVGALAGSRILKW